MPIKQTYRNASLVDAVQHIVAAASAERMTPRAVENLWSGLTDSARTGLINRAEEPASDGSTLADWKAGFPSDLGSLTDAEASALIRVAVALAGGTIVEEVA